MATPTPKHLSLTAGTHAEIDTRSIYHPGPLYADKGHVEEIMEGGGISVRYESTLPGHPSTVADFTRTEVIKMWRKGLL